MRVDKYGECGTTEQRKAKTGGDKRKERYSWFNPKQSLRKGADKSEQEKALALTLNEGDLLVVECRSKKG